MVVTMTDHDDVAAERVAVASRVRSFLVDVMAMTGCDESELARLARLRSRTHVYALISDRGQPDVAARVLARVTGLVGVNLARLVLGPEGGDWFLSPELRHLNPDRASDRGDIAKVYCDRIHAAREAAVSPHEPETE